MSEPKDRVTYIIKPPGKLSLNLNELWRYRELFYFFTWRDIKVKYKQTILGLLWAVLQPLLMMAIFVFFFSKALKIPTDNIPAPIFYFSGLLLWNIFSSGINGAGNSMISNANIIKKIYFPRLVIPISSILVSLFDFMIAFALFLGIMIFYSFNGYEFSFFQVLACYTFGLLLTFTTTFGLGCLIASLNVKYRDFRYIIPFLIQVLFFLTPVIYPGSVISEVWLKDLLSLNPMSSAIEVSRSAFTDIPLDWRAISISSVSALVFSIVGVFNFRKSEAYFADLA